MTGDTSRPTREHAAATGAATDHELQRIGPDDWEVFRDVRLRSLADAPEAFGSRHDDWAHAPEERWRDRLTSVPFNVVARRVEEVVGVTSGVIVGDDAVELISMWVSPDARGTGTGGALIDAVVEWAEAQGRRTYLMVRDDNLRAIASYERAGFVDRGVPEGQAADQPPERLMELPLGTRRTT